MTNDAFASFWLTNTFQVVLMNTNVPVSNMTWVDQCSFFLYGFSYGWPMALSLAVFWGIVRAVRGSNFRPPSSHD